MLIQPVQWEGVGGGVGGLCFWEGGGVVLFDYVLIEKMGQQHLGIFFLLELLVRGLRKDTEVYNICKPCD